MVKINQIALENVKRVKAVQLMPTANGLTIIGGRNGQGKTSVLDAIAWALGGAKFAPSEAKREGSVSAPKIHIELSNGLVVERAGKNSTLKVTDPSGKKTGQRILDELIETLALNLPSFMAASPVEKGKKLLTIIGVEDEVRKLDEEEAALYNRRTEIGRIAEQKKHFAAEMAFYPDCPKEPVSASELIAEQQEILRRNAENQQKRERVREIEAKLAAAQSRKAELEEALAKVCAELDEARADLDTAQKSALDLEDESTAELEENIANVDALNVKIRANLDREKAE
ncbi:MAG: AAA family ATPase, partial [Schwartzia sp.]|nr:AAA family ATPase [Schwartzia sp. (in: firmicutes)]